MDQLGLWNVFEDCHENEDTRCISGGAGKNSLYDVQSFGKILPQQPVFSSPTVHAAQAGNNNIALSADGFLTILGEGGSTHKATVNLECRIEVLCFRPDGEMIIAGDSSGVIHLISVSTCKIIFSHKVVDNNSNQSNNKQFSMERNSEPLFCSAVCSEDHQNTGAYFLGFGLCSSRFLLFSNVKLSLLEKAHTANDFEQMKLIQMEMSMREYDTSNVHTASMTNILSVNNGFYQKFITIGRGQCCLAVWREDFDPFIESSSDGQPSFVLQSFARSSLINQTDDVSILKAVQLNQHIYTLDSKGNICLWHSENLVLCRIWRNTNIKDLTITHAGLEIGNESAKLYAVVSDDQTEHLNICVYQIPNMSPSFTYRCSGQGFCKIAIGPSFLEDIVYIDGDMRGTISSVCLHRICEALPEDRVLRLLNKRRFDEAEKFALAYNLDVQQVYHQKASFLASMISNFAEGNLKQLFEELVDCLKKLKDNTVVAEICLEIIIPDVHMNYKLLDMGRSCLANAIPSQSNGTNDVDKETDEKDILLQIINRMDRLVTFRVAHGYSQEDGAEWIRFCNADLPMELMRLLSMGNISAAATVLLRHKASLLSFLEVSGQNPSDSAIVEKHLQAFLEHIPDTVNIDIIVRWLEDSLVPTLLPRISCSLKVLAVWLHIRAESYEHSNPSEWPEIGLKMANVLFNVQNNLSGLGFMRDQLSSASQAFKSTSVEVARLRLLASRLQLLLQLKQKYKCNVTLAEFIEETTMSLTYRMLDRVMVPELIPSVLQMTVRPYMREHNLGEEEVLLGYVEDLLSRFRDQSWGSVESLRERKIVAIIQCMSDQEVFLEAAVKLAKRASVPWSEDIHLLIIKGIKIAESPLEHDGSGDIEKNAELHAKRKLFLKELQYSKHIEQLPTVLAEYGITKIAMNNSLSHEKIVRFLIHQGTKEALNQAKYFCKTFTTISVIDMYRFRLILLLEKGKAEDCIYLLQEAEKENFLIAVSLVKRAIHMVEIFLNMNKEEASDERMAYCNAVIQMIEYILKRFKEKNVPDNGENNETVLFFQEKLSLLENIVALQTQCSEFISVDEFKDEKFRTSLVSRYIDEYSASGLENEDFADSINYSSSGNRTKLMSASIFQDTLSNSTQKIQTDDSKLSDECQEGPKQLGLASTSSLCRILNLARILEVPSEKLRSWIALNAAKNGGSGIKTAAHLCRELLRISPTEDVAEVTFNVVIEALKHLTVSTRDVMELISKLLNLSISAMMYCKPDQMNDGMGMCKFFILCDELRKVVDDNQGIFSCRESVTNKDPYSNITTLYPWLEDGSGLMLQSNQVLPIFMKIAESLMNNGNTEADITMLHQLALEMTTTLQGARQSQLSLLWTITCISISMRRMANLCDPLAEDISNTVTKQMLTIIEELNKILPEYVDDCIKKVLSAGVVDVSMVIGLLTLLPISRAHKLLHSELNKAGNNCKRIMSIARAGIATLRLNSMEVEVEKFQHLFLDSRWGELLRPLQIQFDQAYFSHPSHKTIILKKLIQHPEATGQLIKDFCLDYDLDLTSALSEFTRVLLSDSSCLFATPELRKLSMSDGEGTLMSFDSLNVPRMSFKMMSWEDSKTKPIKNEGVKCKETEGSRTWSSVKNEMAFVMSAINDKNELCHQMVRILRSECSPYHYKRAKFILSLISECMCVQSEVDVNKGLDLIECLKLVKRSGPVTEYERQHWNFGTDIRTMHKLPEISNERLPLHPLLFGDSSSTWKILTPELNEHTATTLSPIARILSLNIDKMYMTAADNFIGVHMNKDKDHQLSLTPQQLNSVKILTKEVKDYRMATAMAKRVAGLLPISEQKVQAYEWCTQLAETWRNSVSEEDPDYATIVNTHRSLRSYFHSVAVELVLQKHKLTSDNVTVLTSSPEKLILLLYQHPTVVQRYFKPDAENYPDIHSATNEIAEIHSLNIFKLRMSISMEWLLSANFSQNTNSEEDSTVNLANMKASNIVNSGPDTASSMNNDVIRLLYVLSHMLTKQTAKFLLGFAFDRKNTRVTNACRVRALQCVLQLFNDDLIEELTNENVAAIREKLRLLIYLSELESIGFSISGSQLQSGKKDEVARSILASPKFRHNTRAICVASELCREYNAWCPSTWQLLLQQMVALRQISYLRHLLPDICCHATISSLPCLATVWQSCVTSPLAAMTPPLNNEEVNAAVVSYHFLLACPVLLQIDLIRIAQHFCSIELPLLALGCLLADPSQDDNSRKLALANYDLIHKQLEQHPTILGQRQIIEVLRLCDTEKQ